jgi:iron(III) transport system permease protein
VLGFVVPALYLAGAAWTRVSEHGLPRGLGEWIGNTLGFAFSATIVVTVLGLALAYTIRLVRHPAARVLARAAGIGYAIPGTVLAVGLLVPLGALDNAIADAWKAVFGFSPGLIFIGSGAALVIAYTIRFLTIAIGGGESGLAKISPSLDMVSRTLGAGPAKTALEIHLPLMLPAIGAAAILVFVDCMKELPATLLLRPFNFETLATQIYGEAARGTYEDGAISALVIVLVGLIPVLVLSRMGRRQAWRQVAGGSGG